MIKDATDPNVFFFSFSGCYLCWNSLEVVCFVFHFSSFPFGKPSKALFCFSLSLWSASLHHLVSPKETGRLDSFAASFRLQLQARLPLMFTVPISRWAFQRWIMWELGMFLPVSPMSFLAVTVPGKIKDYWIYGKTYKRQHSANNSLS